MPGIVEYEILHILWIKKYNILNWFWSNKGFVILMVCILLPNRALWCFMSDQLEMLLVFKALVMGVFNAIVWLCTASYFRAYAFNIRAFIIRVLLATALFIIIAGLVSLGVSIVLLGLSSISPVFRVYIIEKIIDSLGTDFLIFNINRGCMRCAENGIEMTVHDGKHCPRPGCGYMYRSKDWDQSIANITSGPGYGPEGLADIKGSGSGSGSGSGAASGTGAGPNANQKVVTTMDKSKKIMSITFEDIFKSSNSKPN